LVLIMRSAIPALLIALLPVLASPAAAQANGGERAGWIGISLDVPAVRGRVQDLPVLIGEVHRGSPAENAGLRPGDRLLAVGDLRTTDDFQNLPERLRLEVGEPVRISIEREGRSFDVILTAAERPASLRPRTIRLAMEPDSIVEAMVRAMDSLRLQLVGVRRDNDRIAESTTRVRVVRDTRPSAFIAPFEFHVFRGEQHDSLMQAMDELTRITADLKRQEQARILQLRASRLAIADTDEELMALRASLEDITRRSAELRTAMSEAARATAGFDYGISGWPAGLQSWWTNPPLPPEWSPAASAQQQPEQPPTFRPLTPYLLGSNRVAGAQVIDLRPELAQYFAVEGGVLVVDVSPGTPAAMAGLVPGDVIVRIDQVGIQSVEDLRLGVSRAGDALPLSLVRRGSTVEVLLRRR
jgi:membrane-associated protease RseP (regulator of RpoE activity)